MFKNLKITTKITLIVGLIITFSLFTISYIGFTAANGYIKATRMAALENIASLKVDKIETFFYERRGDIKTAQDYYNIKTNLPIVTQFANDRTNPAYIKAKNALDSQLKTFQNVYGYNDIMLIGPEGKVVYLSNEAHVKNELDKVLPDDSRGMTFEEGKEGICYSDIYKNEGNGYEMLIMAPVNDFNGRFIGVICLEVNMEPIYKFIQDTTGLGETGETLIAKSMGDSAMFLNTLRHDNKSALNRKAAFGERDAYPLQEATSGRSGSGISIDYRGKEVMAAWKHIPSMNWGLVAKIDTSEAYALTNRLCNIILISTCIILVISMIIACLFSRTITTPIRKLTDVAYHIKRGNFMLRADIRSRDEVGILSDSFNAMTERLQKEIDEHKLAEDNAVKQTKIIAAIDNVLRESLTLKTEEDIGKMFLVTAEKLTDSKFGFIGMLNKKGLLDDVAISNPGWDACEMAVNDAKMLIKNMPIRGVDRATIRDGKSRIVNGGKAILNHPDHVKLPEGHPKMTSFLGVPLKRMGETIGMIGLGNKENGYNESDQKTIEALSVAFIEALMYRKAEEDLKNSNRSLLLEIAERKRIEEKLIGKERLAILGKFAGGVGHELRNPLGVIGNSVYFLKMVLTDADDKVKEYLEKISSEVKRSTEIISGLLEFGRVQPLIKKEEVKAINMITLALERMPTPENIEVKTAIPSDLPAVFVDQRKIEQVLLNLISNGYQAMPEEGRLTITAGAEKQYVNISISDTGTGISPENMDKIFEPLFTTKIRGFGIGLVLAKSLTESNGGSIEVKSEEGKGATFTVKLPARKAVS